MSPQGDTPEGCILAYHKETPTLGTDAHLGRVHRSNGIRPTQITPSSAEQQLRPTELKPSSRESVRRKRRILISWNFLDPTPQIWKDLAEWNSLPV